MCRKYYIEQLTLKWKAIQFLCSCVEWGCSIRSLRHCTSKGAVPTYCQLSCTNCMAPNLHNKKNPYFEECWIPEHLAIVDPTFKKWILLPRLFPFYKIISPCTIEHAYTGNTSFEGICTLCSDDGQIISIRCISVSIFWLQFVSFQLDLCFLGKNLVK